VKNSPFFWILKRMKKRIPAIALLTAAQVGHALFSVFFALGSRGVIDSAVAGEPKAFIMACIRQGLISFKHRFHYGVFGIGNCNLCITLS